MLLVFLMGAATQGHVVEQFYAEFEEGEDGAWTLEVLFDAGYADARTRDDPEMPAPSRVWLLDQGEVEWRVMREEAAGYLEGMLVWSGVGWDELEFPDFEEVPPAFPVLLNEGAYFRVLLRGSGGAFVGVGEGYPSLVVLVDGEILAIGPGEEKWLRKPGRWESVLMWVYQGFRHVIPAGLDHLLFVVALFCYRREWKPLFGQSLAFTGAHALTMALAAAGVVTFPQKGVEVLIAVSLVLVGLENLGKRKRLRWRVLLVFVLGLLHGLGFAGALAPWMGEGDRFVASVALMNLGVELAQVLILAGLWVLTLSWSEKRGYEAIRKGTSIAVAGAGLCWVVLRVAG